MASKKKVAVLRGGQSGYEESLKTGGHILSVLRNDLEHYEPIDIFISRDGEWHREGLVYEPHHALKKADLVWNALRGPYGEEGQVQKILERLKMPYTGSSASASALAHDRHFAKDMYRRHSLLTPAHELITADDFSDDKLIAIFRTYMHPVVVSTASKHASAESRVVHAFGELKDAVKDLLSISPRVMVEEGVRGDEAVCLVVDEAKGERMYTPIPATKSGFSIMENNKEMERMARIAHESLGLKHYSGSHFIITPRKKIYIIGTDPSPVMDDESLARRSFHTTGWKPHEFVEHVLTLIVR